MIAWFISEFYDFNSVSRFIVINNKGCNKYLKLDGETLISIDESKYKDDSKWDGLNGYF